MEKFFVPTHVGPSKLDLLLADAVELDDAQKEKVILLTDIGRLAKLLYTHQLTPKEFYDFYDRPLDELQQYQHDLQTTYNTELYQKSLKDADF